jgi:hypothetical protein
VTSPTFPFIGVIAPLVLSSIVWGVTGSTFALVSAVIAPTMVVAHFVDARRRARRDGREKRAARAREDAARREADSARRLADIAAEQRTHPSVADIARCEGWLPPRDGRTLVRAGHYSDGRPWLVDVSGGVAVVGEGGAGDSVWESLYVQGTAHLGSPRRDGNRVVWSGGAHIVRGSEALVATTIRCTGHQVVSVARRGSLPEHGDWHSDDTRPDVLVPARALVSNDVTDPLVLTLSSETPHALFAGRTGSGKSHALVATVSDWADRFSPAEFTFIGIDFKGGATLRQLERFPHHRGTVTDLEPSEVPRVLCAIAAEMRRREEELRRLEISSIDVARDIPRLAIVVDEVHEFLRQFPNAHEVLGDVARRGRSLGVHLVVAVQHPTGVLRDSVLGNIPVRVCLAMNTSHDVMAVLGQSTTLTPSPGGALVTTGDGRVREVRIPTVTAAGDGTQRASADRLWQTTLRSPVARDGRDGFGLLDDVPRARHTPAVWSPDDGDVAVIGEAGSGRTTALRTLTRGLEVTWVREPQHLAGAQGIVAIDNLDRILDSLTATAASDFLAAIARVRRQSVRVLVTATSLIRGLDPFRDILTLRRATLDDHRATGAPVDTFDPAARPGVGTWRGLRVVLYASTESMDTASIP